MTIIREQLLVRLTDRGLALDPGRFESLCSYLELLVKWNRRINLTGFSLEDGITAAAFDRLFLEPIAAARIGGSAARVLDIGSGGGSPAIPFFLGLESASEIVLVESRTRKAVFLREALRTTGIPGSVIGNRFEGLVVPGLFEVVTIRAVAPDAPLWDLIRRALSADGRVFWFHSAAQVQPRQEVVVWDTPVRLDADSRLSIGTRLP